MLTKLKLALLVAAPLVAGPLAVAHAAPPAPKELLQKYDQNGDGKLDDAERTELTAAFEARRAERHKQRLAAHDTNHDGKLDDAERTAMRDARTTTRFKAMDTNGDGKLTLDEFKAGRPDKAGHRRHGRHGRFRHGRSSGLTP